jgi:hypothetical protein
MRGRMKNRGVSMALYAMFLAFVGVPLLGATVDVTRVWLAKAELANAVQAACSAYANSADLWTFKNQETLKLGAEARAEGYRFFGYNIPKGATLDSMEYAVSPDYINSNTIIASCRGSMDFKPVILAGLVSIKIEKSTTVKVKFATTANWAPPG